jgi:hypothetical protein
MILSSPGGHRKLRLRSPKSLLSNSSSREVSAIRHSSLERQRKIHHWSLTGGSPYSNNSECGQHEETSAWYFSSNGDPEGAGGGVLAPLGDGLFSLEIERARCVPLLSSIDCKRGARKVNLGEKERRYAIWLSTKMNEIFIALEASHDYSNRHYFDSRASAQVHHFDNRASCTGYSDGQANCTIF